MRHQLHPLCTPYASWTQLFVLLKLFRRLSSNRLLEHVKHCTSISSQHRSHRQTDATSHAAATSRPSLHPRCQCDGIYIAVRRGEERQYFKLAAFLHVGLRNPIGSLGGRTPTPRRASCRRSRAWGPATRPSVSQWDRERKGSREGNQPSKQ